MHQSIDWFSWLSKTRLEPSLIYEYGMAFSRNELEEDDITYFNHEFLQSMGISIAKHRLEILKLARKQHGSHPISKLMITIKRTLTRFIRTWVHNDDSSLVVVSRSYSSGWKGNMLRTSKRLEPTFKQATPTQLLLTNCCHKSNSIKVSGLSSPLQVIYNNDQEKKDGGHGCLDDQKGGGHGDGGGFEVIKWDKMFQNLKPT